MLYHLTVTSLAGGWWRLCVSVVLELLQVLCSKIRKKNKWSGRWFRAFTLGGRILSKVISLFKIWYAFLSIIIFVPYSGTSNYFRLWFLHNVICWVYNSSCCTFPHWKRVFQRCRKCGCTDFKAGCLAWVWFEQLKCCCLWLEGRSTARQI